MKQPKPRGTPIDSRRLRLWTRWYGEYTGVNDGSIRDWLDQFDQQDQDLAARILDCVEFFGQIQITSAYRATLNSISGWHIEESRRHGTWRFAPYSASAGESGDSMLHKFRVANNLAGRHYDPLFIYRSEILAQRLGPDDTLVLVDDFIGSGRQASENWPIFAELVGEVGRVILIVVAAFHAGRMRIRQETELEIHSNHDLSEAYNILSDRCSRFSAEEKLKLLEYCEHADPNEPRGHGDCGLLVVFSHGCPNNSVPILHAANQRWEALFRRYE